MEIDEFMLACKHDEVRISGMLIDWNIKKKEGVLIFSKDTAKVLCEQLQEQIKGENKNGNQ